jgi:hypothetical protein
MGGAFSFRRNGGMADMGFWASFLVNLLSDLAFLGILVLVSCLLWRKNVAKASRFFGIGPQKRIEMHLSVLKCEGLRTGKAIAVEEYEAANEFREVLGRPLSGFFVFLARALNIDPGELKIVVQSSPPVDEVGEVSLRSGSHILIGGPECNSLTAHYLGEGRAWIKFDTDQDEFLICLDRSAVARRVPRFHGALLEKLVVNGKTVIIAFGDGEVETHEAVRYLAYRWKELLSAAENKDGEFALLWSVKTGQVEERFGLVDDNKA